MLSETPIQIALYKLPLLYERHRHLEAQLVIQKLVHKLFLDIAELKFATFILY